MDPHAADREAARLQALRRYNVLDTTPEDAFDDLTSLAAHICQTPISLVSLVDADRQWFKSRHGLDVEQTPRSISFCAHAIQQPDVFVIPDTLDDPRFAANPLVTSGPRMRSYAGAPLITPDGHVLGTLCVIDREPRQLTQEQRDSLQRLSRQVMTQLELRRSISDLNVAVTRQEQTEQELRETQEQLESRVQERTEELLQATQSLASEIHRSDHIRARSSAFSDLGYRLSAVKTAEEAARIISGVAQSLFGWDACSLDLYSVATGHIHPVLTLDTIQGVIQDVPHVYTDAAPSPIAARVIREGAQRILRDIFPPPIPSRTATPDDCELIPFGDSFRPSASLLFVPIRSSQEVVGILSIQSYTPQAYTEEDMETLQALADHCGGALERLRVEETLHHSEERLRLACEAARMGVWEYALERDAFSYSEQFAPLFALSPAASPLSGAAFLANVHPDDRDRVEAETAMETLSEYQTEFRVRWPDGTLHWIDSKGKAYADAAGQPARLVGVARDITQRKRLEEQLLQSQKMEGIGRLAGGIAHDFNNLLTAILGYAQMAEDEIPADDFAAECLRNVVKAADRAAGLTQQLLAFARKQIIRPRVVTVNTLIRDMEEILRRLIGEHITLLVRTQADAGQIKVDPGQFDQVLMNLVVNARDAMPDGGTLTIATSCVVIDLHSVREQEELLPGDYALVTVTDTGTGIPEAIRAHLFEPFFTTKEPGKGTGLGLATCYGIVKQSGGYLGVTSESGSGAVFSIYLPRVQENESRSLPAEAPLQKSADAVLLLVEDEALVREMAGRALRAQGYTVLEAANGVEAWKRSQEYAGEIALLITDVVMPQMGGSQLAERLCASRPTLKVLFTSGYTDDEIVQHGVLNPGLCFLHKPFTPSALARKVQETLHGDSQPPV